MSVPIHLRGKLEQIENSLSYRPMHQDQAQRSHQIREKAKELACLMIELAPPSNALEIGLNEFKSALLWVDEAIKREMRKDDNT